jgi:alpha-1,4-digalacturonate transport system substrate-binding protein
MLASRRGSCAVLLSAMALLASATAFPATVTLRYMCYADGNECVVMDELLRRFTRENPGIVVAVETVPYRAIVESLPVQLAAGRGPDLARVTDLGGLRRHYLDVAPYVDAAYIERNFSSTLGWTRAHPGDRGIYGLVPLLTMTGPFVNKTLFDQANVPLPSGRVTWEEWAALTARVARATRTPFAMVMDRSGHRFAGAAISFGARLVDTNGEPVIDQGLRTMSRLLVSWHERGLMPMDVWAAAGGSAPRDAFEEFRNANAVMLTSGSWHIGRLENDVRDAFDWVAVPNPCGPAACSGMPGGAAIIVSRYTRHPAEAARVIGFLAGADASRELAERTRSIPGHRAVAEAGVRYRATTPAARAALRVFTGEVTAIAPAAHAFQAYRFQRAMLNALVQRLGQALNDEMTVDEALERVRRDVARAAAATR